MIYESILAWRALILGFRIWKLQHGTQNEILDQVRFFRALKLDIWGRLARKLYVYVKLLRGFSMFLIFGVENVTILVKKNENLPFMWSQNKKHFFWIRNQIRNFLGFFKSHKKRKNKKLGCGKDPGFENPENHGFSKFLKKRKPCIVTARLRAVLYCSKRCR